MNPIEIVTVVGARPQFVKAAVFSRWIRNAQSAPLISETIIHTGQHYDPSLSESFFQDLGIPSPAVNLKVGSGAAAGQLGKMLSGLETVLSERRPALTLVYGDTNSTLAAALASSYVNIPIVHVEGGERIFRRQDVPEETNRILTDHLATINLTCTTRADANLRREGFSQARIAFVGDLMFELFQESKARARSSATVTPATFGLNPDSYCLATLHRAENTSPIERLISILEALDQANIPVILPVHPRVENLLKANSYRPSKSLILHAPLGYFDFLSLLLDAKSVFTDSGGVTREAFFAKKPAVIPMDNTWWADVAESGWSICVDKDPAAIKEMVSEFQPPSTYPEGLFGDGKTAEKIAQHVAETASVEYPSVRWHRFASSSELPRPTNNKFSIPDYQQLLHEIIAAGYQFGTFSEYGRNPRPNLPVVLLRHDIDMDLGYATQLAKVEKALGVTATYFIMLSSEFYNPFTSQGRTLISQILDAGHQIGLHFDAAAYPQIETASELGSLVEHEAETLGRCTGRPVEAVSFHRPNQFILSGAPGISGRLRHTYEACFSSDIWYSSDSRGNWNSGNPLDSKAFQARQAMHLLLHPIWWDQQAIAPFSKLERFLDEKMAFLSRQLALNCATFRVGEFADARNATRR